MNVETLGMLRVVRLKYPTSIRGLLATEKPIKTKPTDRRLVVNLMCGFRFTGGPYHDFMYGFGFTPYGIQFKAGVSFSHRQKGSRFYITFSGVQRTMFESKILLLPKSWDHAIRVHRELCRKAGYGKNIVKGWFMK
jgi:hypothetical protein